MPDIERLPVIFVPGIKGSGLDDYYPVDREVVWSAVATQEYERVAMHPDDTRFESVEPAMIRASAPFPLVYKDIVEALRYELTPDSRKPVPVFAFGYDWRQDCLRSAAQLELMIEEALARTRLLPHYKGKAPARVDIVAHSMGGIVVALLLAAKGRDARIRRVVTIASPFRGSVDALSLLAMGMANLWAGLSRERQREAARSMTAVYQLLPWFDGAVVSDVPEYRDLYDYESWQRSIVQTLELYRKRLNADTSGEDLLKSFLKTAKTVQVNLRKLELATALEEGEAGWLQIAGVNEKTAQQVEVVREGRSPRFRFPAAEDAWPQVATGDGTVPARSTVPPFVDASRVVCVAPRDFSFWELKDRVIASVGGFHAALPLMNLVQRLSIRFLRRDYNGPVWGRRHPEAKATSWPEWIKEKGPLED